MSIATNLSPNDSQNVIYGVLRNNGIPDPLSKLVVAQSGHETNGWTSHVYLTDNNAFGYGYDGSSYKVYGSVEDSALDIVGYLNRRVADGSFPSLDQITDPAQYATLLKNAGYYTDSQTNYAQGIARWFNNNLVLAGGISAGLVIFGLLLFIFLRGK